MSFVAKKKEGGVIFRKTGESNFRPGKGFDPGFRGGKEKARRAFRGGGKRSRSSGGKEETKKSKKVRNFLSSKERGKGERGSFIGTRGVFAHNVNPTKTIKKKKISALNKKRGLPFCHSLETFPLREEIKKNVTVTKNRRKKPHPLTTKSAVFNRHGKLKKKEWERGKTTIHLRKKKRGPGEYHCSSVGREKTGKDEPFSGGIT